MAYGPMKERAFYEAVNRRITNVIHHQSMNYAAASTRGTVDRWYEGEVNDLWVEYKVLRHMPKLPIVVGKYSKDQLKWMTRRFNRRRKNVGIIGIVGLPNRMAALQFTPDDWSRGTPLTDVVSFNEVAIWITNFCGV